MKLAEKKINIFTDIKAVNPNLKMFKYLDSTVLDEYYNVEYSECTLAPIAVTCTPETLGRLLNGFFHVKWDNIIEGYENGLDTLLSFGTRETRETTRKYDRASSDTTINSVTGYNETEFTPDNKSEGSGKGNENETTTQIINRGNVRYFKNVYDYLLQNNFIADIIKDVNSVITLQIYESEEM